MVLAGGTLQEAGDALGISRERVRQFMQDAGLSVKDRRRHGEGDHGRQRQWMRARLARHRRRALHRERILLTADYVRRFFAIYHAPPTYRELFQGMRGFDPGLDAAEIRLAGWLGRPTTGDPRWMLRVHLVYRLAGVRRLVRGAGAWWRRRQSVRVLP